MNTTDVLAAATDYRSATVAYNTARFNEVQAEAAFNLASETRLAAHNKLGQAWDALREAVLTS